MSIESIFKTICEKYTEEQIMGMIDEQISNYTPIDGYDPDEYESNWEWYQDHCDGEAEYDVFCNIKKELNIVGLSLEEELELRELMRDEWGARF